MPKGKKPIEQYDHRDKERLNNPPVGLVTPETDVDTTRKTYSYDPHLDPQLTWAGKAEHTSFEVPTVSLHVHERIDPRSIIETVRKRNGRNYEQASFFHLIQENPLQKYWSDFIIRLKNGNYLVLEAKGQDTRQDRTKREFLNEWGRAVNSNGGLGRWQWVVSTHPSDVSTILQTA